MTVGVWALILALLALVMASWALWLALGYRHVLGELLDAVRAITTVRAILPVSGEAVPQHIPTGDSPFCAVCGLHISGWEERPCYAADSNVRVLRRHPA